MLSVFVGEGQRGHYLPISITYSSLRNTGGGGGGEWVAIAFDAAAPP